LAAGAPRLVGGFLPGVQALRAVAAISVAFTHFLHDAIGNGADPNGWLRWAQTFMPWDAGVDIFFVISGFIIVHASAGLFAAAGGWARFIRRRLTRIVPLYWIMTTLFLVVMFAGPGRIHGDIGGPGYLAASYLFIPWARPDGVVQPALGLGWTLNYEIFFYAVFAPLLLLRRGLAVGLLVLGLGGFVTYGQVFGFANTQLAVWSNPIVLEFAAGMGLALVETAGVALPGAARLGLILAALAALHLAVLAPPALRALTYGLPAAALVAAAVFGRQPGGGSRILVRLGDASYAMYLFHPFVMRAISVSWPKFHAHSELAGTIYVLAGLAAAQICALAINLTLEARLAELFRGRSRGLRNEAV
jgi:peptidoglycan/LPS O-acetylase OafA/YrhL